MNNLDGKTVKFGGPGTDFAKVLIFDSGKPAVAANEDNMPCEFKLVSASGEPNAYHIVANGEDHLQWFDDGVFEWPKGIAGYEDQTFLIEEYGSKYKLMVKSNRKYLCWEDNDARPFPMDTLDDFDVYKGTWDMKLADAPAAEEGPVPAVGLDGKKIELGAPGTNFGKLLR